MTLARLIWRLSNPRVHALESTPMFEKKAAQIAHGFLYTLLLCLFVSGFLISTADGRGIEVFGLIEIPALPYSFDGQEDLAGDVHWAVLNLTPTAAGIL